MVAAEGREFAGILRHCRRPIRLRWPIEVSQAAELNGRRLLLAANGPGPDLAGEAVEAAGSAERVDIIISTGFCGALDPALEVGDIFVALRIESPEQGIMLAAQRPSTGRSFASGALISIDRVAQTVAEKRRLRAAGASAVEMEAAAVGVRAGRWGVPFFCVRVVTDRAEEGFAMDFNAARSHDGRFSRAKILKAALGRPGVLFPELIRLHHRSRAAAQALGDFIADCRF